jgi:hypothetical protein
MSVSEVDIGLVEDSGPLEGGGCVVTDGQLKSQ